MSKGVKGFMGGLGGPGDDLRKSCRKEKSFFKKKENGFIIIVENNLPILP
jgi:hypothetical protein